MSSWRSYAHHSEFNYQQFHRTMINSRFTPMNPMCLQEVCPSSDRVNWRYKIRKEVNPITESTYLKFFNSINQENVYLFRNTSVRCPRSHHQWCCPGVLRIWGFTACWWCSNTNMRIRNENCENINHIIQITLKENFEP